MWFTRGLGSCRVVRVALAALLLAALAAPWTSGAEAAAPHAGATTSTDWPLFQSNLQRWGQANASSTFGAAVPHVVRMWSYQTGGQVYSSPVVQDGAVYAGSEDGCVYALDAGTGALLWRYRTHGFILNAPAAGNGLVYAGSEDGSFYALDAASGALRWAYVAAAQTQFGVVSSAAVDGGLVIITAHDPAAVIALDAATGAVRWVAPQTEPMSWSSPSVLSGTVYVGETSGYVKALNETTGRTVWTAKVRTNIKVPAMLVDGLAIVADDAGYVTALLQATGHVEATFQTGGAINTALATDGSSVYVASYDGNLYALSLPGLTVHGRRPLAPRRRPAV